MTNGTKKKDDLKSALRDNLKKRKQQLRRFKHTDDNNTPSMKLRKRDFSKEK